MTIWKNTCGGSWQGTIENGGEVSGKPGAFLFFIPKGALAHHLLKQAVVALPLVGHVRSLRAKSRLRRLPSETHLRVQSEGDCGSCGSRWTRLHFCQTASLLHAVGAGVSVLEAPVHGVVYCHPIPPSACVNLPPAA